MIVAWLARRFRRPTEDVRRAEGGGMPLFGLAKAASSAAVAAGTESARERLAKEGAIDHPVA